MILTIDEYNYISEKYYPNDFIRLHFYERKFILYKDIEKHQWDTFEKVINKEHLIFDMDKFHLFSVRTDKLLIYDPNYEVKTEHNLDSVRIILELSYFEIKNKEFVLPYLNEKESNEFKEFLDTGKI